MTNWRTPAFEALNQRVVGLVGGKTAEEFEKLGVRTVGELLRYAPRRYLAGTEMSDFSSLKIDDDVALVARVHRTEHAYGRKQRLVVTLTDGTGQYITATFFAARDHLIKYWQKVLAVGVRGIFIGRVGEFNGHIQLSHPDFVVLDSDNHVVAGKAGEREAISRATQRSTLVGIYPASAKLPTWVIADSAAMAVQVAETIPDAYPEWVLEAGGIEPINTAFARLHAPIDVEESKLGMRRLRFDEALLTQVSLGYRKHARREQVVSPLLPASDGVLSAFDAQLPFQLTEGQLRASAEIFSDLAQPHPMNRLLQGEVGSGKTVVALRAMLAAVDAGGQASLLAPTEVLARQHFRSVSKLLGELGHGVMNEGVRVGLLVGGQSAPTRKATQAQLAAGEIDVVIGTHALLSEGVSFANLALVVVDEQHRFGVEQRAALAAKAVNQPHALVMTATPIPRTVAMTVFGDLEVTELNELPAGRAEVKTVYVNTVQHPNWVARAWERVAEEVAKGRQAFIVCPRIDPDDAEVGDDSLEEIGAGRSLTAVTSLADSLRAGPLNGLRLGVAHGRQSAAERDEVMQAFAAGDLDVLVATTVVEVGVDVPNASMMVVMDADRFGLAQLHQLRGRIGRGAYEGLCLLLAPIAAGQDNAAERLQAMVATRNGFDLAETDLQLRREGNVLGAQQSGGASTLRALRVLEDVDIIHLARDIANQVIDEDPTAAQDWVKDLLAQADSAGYWAERT